MFESIKRLFGFGKNSSTPRRNDNIALTLNSDNELASLVFARPDPYDTVLGASARKAPAPPFRAPPFRAPPPPVSNRD